MKTHPLHLMAHAAALAALAAAAPARAENSLFIDNFSTGHFAAKPITKGRVTSSQTGAMLNGQRSTTLDVCEDHCATQNPYNQGVSYRYADSRANPGHGAFVISAPIFTYPRIDIGYGSMNQNWTAYTLIRLNFIAVTQPLAQGMLIYTGSGRGMLSCEVPVSSQPISVELPFDNFSSENGGFSRGDVTDIDFFLYSSLVGGVEYAISSIELSDTPHGGAIVCPKVTQP